MRIATRIRLLGPALVLVTACLVGLVVFWGYTALVSELHRRALSAQLDADVVQLEGGLVEIQHDIQMLARLSAVRQLVAATANESTNREGDDQRADDIADIFASMLASKPDYEQIRVIGLADDGRELVRVNRSRDQIVRTPEAALQPKSHRDYFQDALALPAGQVHISKISLNREFGALETPHRPMLRAVMSLHLADGAPLGLVIINVNFASFSERLFPAAHDGFALYLANADGDYLLHPDLGRTFGFDRDERYAIQDEFPGLAGIFTPGARNATTELPGGVVRSRGLIEVRRVHPYEDEPDAFLLLALSASFDVTNAGSAVIGVQMFALTLVLLLVGAVAAFVLAWRLVQPLSQLANTADSVARDGHGAFSMSSRGDEIGSLSRSLDHMMTVLARQKTYLEQANTDLEYFARIASHDLREPARRMAMLANLLEVDEFERVSEGGRETLQRMRAEGLRMVEQLTELRAFSRLGQRALEREPVDLVGLVEALLETHRESLARRRVQIVVEALPRLRVYRNLVELLYGNLIANALHHAGEDGFALAFTCEERDGESVLGVRNTGSTITVAPESVFEPFRGGSDDGERSGLGLSICRRIVGRHAGRIWVEFGADHVHVLFTLKGGDLVA